MANLTDSIRTVLSESNKDIIIEDPVLEPYFIINYSEGGWGVCVKRLTAREELKYREICYPTRFGSCLNEIAKQKLHDRGKDYSSIQQYIDDWRKMILDAHKVWNVPEI